MDAPARQTASAPLLRLEGVKKHFQMGEVTVEALRDVSLEVYEGEMLVMVGPSGSGKTTILNIVGGLDTAIGRRGLVPRPPDDPLHARRADPLSPRHGGLRLPVLQPGAQPHRPGKRDGRHRDQRRPDGRRRGPAAGRPGRPHGPFSLAAFRRRAAAGGHRPGAGQEPRAGALRRADRGAGLCHGQAGAAAAGRPEGAAGQDDRADHPQRRDRPGGRPRDPAAQRAGGRDARQRRGRFRRRRSSGERAGPQAATRGEGFAGRCCWRS